MIILSLILIIGGIFGFGVWFTRYCDYRQECKHNLFEHDRTMNEFKVGKIIGSRKCIPVKINIKQRL